MERVDTESSGLPILVVEDEDAILRGLCDVLAFRGYAPEGVARGDLGLEMALDAERNPALVLLDVMLPGMSGFDVCEKLRAARPKLPILMLTAKDGVYDEAEGLDTGADDYLTKPFSFVVLLARLRALIRRSAQTGYDTITIGDLDRKSAEHFRLPIAQLVEGRNPAVRRRQDHAAL